MKNKIILAFIIISSYYPISTLQAQTLSPQVIASAGGYQSNASGSLSFTISETNTQTLTSANHMLTQGFQQPYKMTLNLKAFIQGYYQGGGFMENVLYAQGVTALAGIECDTIQIELRQSTWPYALLSATTQVIQTNGMVIFNGTAAAGQAYYIVLKHRNALETWSANPVMLTENTLYDFTTAANKAYGDNQVEVESGVWAFYSGDINQDENMDLLDASILETSIANFDFGYFATDLNGDGNVDLLDSPMLEVNVNAFIYSVHP
ncbi:MAG: hypothetical protein IPI46_00700 [Bacteroidetes bacterium]|nr:hypothetical protein [Bacteroidota bacterium]